MMVERWLLCLVLRERRSVRWDVWLSWLLELCLVLELMIVLGLLDCDWNDGWVWDDG